MIKKPQTIIKNLFISSKKDLSVGDVQQARDYIAKYWEKLERYHPKDDETLLGLPNKYIVPASEESHQFDFNEMYYWDSYFMVQGMYNDPTKKDLVVGILDNLISMYNRFKIIPNASRTYLMGRSQPPFLSSFIFEVYQAYDMSQSWLTEKMQIAQNEYNSVWMGTKKPNERQVYAGLSRYYDINYLNDLAEAESGWDMTPRFERKALNFLPVDLNSLLYKYETDFAKAAQINGDITTAKQWLKVAQIRKNSIDALMWNEMRGFYYDYNFKKERRGTVSSLAGFYTMWAGLADKNRAVKMVKFLKKFDEDGGLATTDPQPISLNIIPGSMPQQWAHPNGWAPLHLIVIQGLERYGYHAEARKIAQKWLKCNLAWFDKNGVFLEKYNVVDINKPPAKGVYPGQTGFGWTNAVFEYLCQKYVDEPK